jgi:hypothetical protein
MKIKENKTVKITNVVKEEFNISIDDIANAVTA